MDPNQQKKKGGKDKFDFAVHSERSHQVAAEARAERGSGRNLNPTRTVFPASNANALARGPPVTAPPAQTPMEVDAYTSTEGESRRERERGRSWQHQDRPPSPHRQRYHDAYQRPPSLERLRDDVVRSRAPLHLEEEIARLREENERLQNRLRLADFDRQQCDQKMAFLEEQLDRRVSKPYRRDDSKSSLYYHPYHRPERSGYSRDSSPGPDRPKRVLKSTIGPKIVAPPPPRIEQSLDTTMTDASRQTTAPPPPLASATSSVAPSSSAAGTSSAPAPSYEKDPYMWHDAQGDDDEWDDEDDEDHDRKEKLRMIRVAHKAAREKKSIPPPAVSYDSSPELHGNWYGVPIVTIDDWDQLYNAAMKGDDFAVGYIAFLNSKYQRPSEHRTAGIARLIQGYAGVGKNRPDAMKAYKAKVAAVKRKADPATPSLTTNRPVPAAPATSTLRNPLPEGVDSPDYYISQSPLGHCLALPGPPPRNFFEDTTNPRDPPQAVGREWAATPVANWPLGLRVISSTGSPREPNEKEIAGEPAVPDLTDVEALRWISELSPFRRRRDVATRAARRTWYDRCIALFSVPGLYAAIIKRLGFPGGCRRRERFPFDTRNLDAIQVALWFHDHSLYPIRPEVQDIERWAKLVRGLDGEIQDNDGNWSRFPHNIASVLEDNPALNDAATTFQYPPRVPSAHSRSWATASERHVDEQRAARGLSRLLNDVAPGDESADEDMDPKSPPRPSGSA
jgi:hypothetical protein